MLPITHKSVRQLQIVNKDGGPNSFSFRFFKSYREIDTVLSDNIVMGLIRKPSRRHFVDIQPPPLVLTADLSH